MSTQAKFIIGLVLGFAGYMAYTKLKKTQTVTVDTFDTYVPTIIGDGSNIAGLRH